VAAEDDLGLARLAVTIQRPGHLDTTNHLALDPDTHASTAAEATHTLDTAALGLQPGDRLTYFAEATDNHPTRPQSARTTPHTVEVITLEEFQQTLTTMSTAPPQLIAPGNASSANPASPTDAANENEDENENNDANHNTNPADGNALNPANAPGASANGEGSTQANPGASPSASPNASASPGTSPSSQVGSGTGTGFGTAGRSGSAALGDVGLIGPGSPTGDAPLNTAAPDAPTSQPPPDAAVESVEGAEADATNLGTTPQPPVLRANRTEAFNPAADRRTPTDPIADPDAAPPAYRDEAAAYFRRLADDAATANLDAPSPD
ncbi:MAG: hypothetical protein AAF078_12525, partial [Planctomycetota bacterium]